MSIIHISAYKAELAANEKKRLVALDFMQVETGAAYDVRRILSYRPFPIHRVLEPGTAKFEEANLGKSALQILNSNVFLEDVLNCFGLLPLDMFLHKNAVARQENMRFVSTEPFAACASTIEKYLMRYPECAMDENSSSNIDKAKARSICLREFQKTVADLFDKKCDEVKKDWTAAFKSTPDWMQWGALRKVACIPSQEAKNYALFAIKCMAEDAREAITALQSWSVAGHAITQREAWLAKKESQEMFAANRAYASLSLPLEQVALPHLRITLPIPCL